MPFLRPSRVLYFQLQTGHVYCNIITSHLMGTFPFKFFSCSGGWHGTTKKCAGTFIISPVLTTRCLCCAMRFETVSILLCILPAVDCYVFITISSRLIIGRFLVDRIEASSRYRRIVVYCMPFLIPRVSIVVFMQSLQNIYTWL